MVDQKPSTTQYHIVLVCGDGHRDVVGERPDASLDSYLYRAAPRMKQELHRPTVTIVLEIGEFSFVSQIETQVTKGPDYGHQGVPISHSIQIGLLLCAQRDQRGLEIERCHRVVLLVDSDSSRTVRTSQGIDRKKTRTAAEDGFDSSALMVGRN